jgi:hypothetical protein
LEPHPFLAKNCFQSLYCEKRGFKCFCIKEDRAHEHDLSDKKNKIHWKFIHSQDETTSDDSLKSFRKMQARLHVDEGRGKKRLLSIPTKKYDENGKICCLSHYEKIWIESRYNVDEKLLSFFVYQF